MSGYTSIFGFETDGGPEGPPGPPGQQGGQGTQGPDGPQGISGSATNTGPTGATGSMGATGSTGSTGSTGPTGSVGPQGPIGGGVFPTIPYEYIFADDQGAPASSTLLYYDTDASSVVLGPAVATTSALTLQATSPISLVADAPSGQTTGTLSPVPYTPASTNTTTITPLNYYADGSTQVLARYYYAVPAQGLNVPAGTYSYVPWLSVAVGGAYPGASFLFCLYQTDSTSFTNPVALGLQTVAGASFTSSSVAAPLALSTSVSSPATLSAGKYLCLELRSSVTALGSISATLSTGIGRESVLTYPVGSQDVLQVLGRTQDVVLGVNTQLGRVYGSGMPIVQWIRYFTSSAASTLPSPLPTADTSISMIQINFTIICIATTSVYFRLYDTGTLMSGAGSYQTVYNQVVLSGFSGTPNAFIAGASLSLQAGVPFSGTVQLFPTPQGTRFIARASYQSSSGAFQTLQTTNGLLGSAGQVPSQIDFVPASGNFDAGSGLTVLSYK